MIKQEETKTPLYLQLLECNAHVERNGRNLGCQCGDVTVPTGKSSFRSMTEARLTHGVNRGCSESRMRVLQAKTSQRLTGSSEAALAL